MEKKMLIDIRVHLLLYERNDVMDERVYIDAIRRSEEDNGEDVVYPFKMIRKQMALPNDKKLSVVDKDGNIIYKEK